MAEKKNKISDKDKAEWDQIVSRPVDGQADAFLKAFIEEFQGKVEVVLDIAEKFKKFLLRKDDVDLAENEAHYFLEKLGEPVTVKTLRDFLKDIDLDNNRRLSFLEYALYKFPHSATEFFVGLRTVRPGGSEALDRAIAAYRAVLKQKADRESKMEDLRKEAAKGGVKGKTAGATLAQMEQEDQLAMNKAEITAAASKRKAEKEAKDDPHTLEMKRIAQKKKEEDDEKKKKADDSRARLAAKAAAFNPNSAKEVVSSIAQKDSKLNKVQTKGDTNTTVQNLKLPRELNTKRGSLTHVDAPKDGVSDSVKEAFKKDREEEKKRAAELAGKD
jgi:hypothetical protein